MSIIVGAFLFPQQIFVKHCWIDRTSNNLASESRPFIIISLHPWHWRNKSGIRECLHWLHVHQKPPTINLLLNAVVDSADSSYVDIPLSGEIPERIFVDLCFFNMMTPILNLIGVHKHISLVLPRICKNALLTVPFPAASSNWVRFCSLCQTLCQFQVRRNCCTTNLIRFLLQMSFSLLAISTCDRLWTWAPVLGSRGQGLPYSSPCSYVLLFY